MLIFPKIISNFISQLKNFDEFILSERQKLRRFDMHFLSLQHVNKFHLFFECLHEFIPLLLELPIVLHKSLHVPPLPLVFALL